MSGEGLLRASLDQSVAGHLDQHALTSAVEAYDAERCRCNDRWHGGKCQPMSAANMESIRPMIAAAVLAYLEGAN